ncbi:MAG: hydantoinase B/oxoprolinase family protein [Alphaproteobacteria bacterium]|nr:hydantoinase B/oxoprolinase family protein [Alphaproteobacteria bacterium]
MMTAKSIGAANAQPVDPITLEVVCEGLIAIVKEMRATIIRASYSSVIYEFDDFSCALFGPEGEMVAQSWDHPGHVLPLPWGVRCALDDFRGDLKPGDAILLNDPYRGGTHLNDVTLVYPLFDEAGRLIIFPAVRAHWVDVGGMVPGSYSGLSSNIYQEGVRIPPIKIFEAGRPNRAAMSLLMANMRVPEEREGDLNASFGACKVAENRIRKLIAKYGQETVMAAVAINLDRTERRLREKIAELPDGDYYYEDYLEFYNEGRLDPVLARIKLTVAGDQIIADFAGTNPQVPGVVNSSLAVAGAGVFVAIKSTLDPGGAVNHGAFRPITLKAPEASIFDVRQDAPAGAHGEVRKRGVSVALGALAQIMPERISGDLCGSSFPNAIGGYNKRRQRQYVYYEAPAGGNGGFLEADGSSAYVNVDFGNLPSIHNVEALENEMPIFVERCVLRTDGGGEGQRRGGVGMQREVRLLDAEGSYSVLSDRAVLPPWGVLGAGSGKPYHVSVRRDNEVIEFDTPGKVTGYPVRRDDVVVMRSSGGGGYGDPLEREPARVKTDLDFGYVSAERARDGYGVVFTPAGEVDEAATKALRGKLQAGRFRLTIKADDALDPYVGAKGKRRMLDLSAADAAKLGVAADDLVELRGRNPAPLRAWVRVAGNGRQGQVPLDEFGRKVLGVKNRESVVVMKLGMPPMPKAMAR